MIRPLEKSDYEDWLILWQENCQHQIGDDITVETWRRLIDDNEPVWGLVAERNNGLAGILHYILHPTTGSKAAVCYMQDLYISAPCRRRGIAKSLISFLEKTGKEQQWARIYWLAESSNVAAQALYKTLGIKLNFSLHILPTS